MYYYKLFYKDGTWDVLDSTSKVTIPTTICRSCIKIQPISKVVYYWLVFIQTIKYFNK